MEHAKHLDEYGDDPDLAGDWDDESSGDDGGFDPFDTDEDYEDLEDEDEDVGDIGRRRQDD